MFWCNDETLTCETCWCKVYLWFISLGVLSYCQPFHARWNFSILKSLSKLSLESLKVRHTTDLSLSSLLTARHFTSLHFVLYKKKSLLLYPVGRIHSHLSSFAISNFLHLSEERREKGQWRCVGVWAVTVLSRKLFEVSTRSRCSGKKGKTKLGDTPVQEAASLHSGGTGPGVKCMEQGGSVSEACRVPTLKWRWHSKIMKNDDEAEEGMPRAHVRS